MFERFTDRARRVVVLAQREARALNHDSIETEHILLGLTREGEGVAVRALLAMDISLEAIRVKVEEIVGRGSEATTGHIPFTPRAKKVLELALREALQLGHDYIGTEHILVGLVAEGEGVAAQVLESLGANLARVREVVLLLEGYVQEPKMSPAPEPAASGVTEASSPKPICPNCFASLEDTLAIRVIQVTVKGGEPTPTKVAYCGRCGVALGTVT